MRVTTSLKFPSISLKKSQNLSKYILKDSPSLMAMESKESRGLGALLHVTNLALNTFVSVGEASVAGRPHVLGEGGYALA